MLQWLFSALYIPLVETGLMLLTQGIEIASRRSAPKSSRAPLMRLVMQTPCDDNIGHTHIEEF